jgi:hypothetical protein
MNSSFFAEILFNDDILKDEYFKLLFGNLDIPVLPNFVR